MFSIRNFFSKQFIAPAFIFLLVFSFSFLFTYSIDFFWEDIFLFAPQESLFSTLSSMLSSLLSTHTLYTIDYGYRPLQHLSWLFFSSLFDTNIILFRLFRSLVFSSLLTLVYLFISRFTGYFFASFPVLFLLWSPELWLSLLYTEDVALYMHFFTVLAFFSFFHFFVLDEESFSSSFSKKHLFFMFLIVLFSRLSVLFKGEGRLLTLVVACYSCYVFILFFLKRATFSFFMTYFLLSSLLIITTLPVLGILRYPFTNVPFLVVPSAPSDGSSLLLFFDRLSFLGSIFGTPLLLFFSLCLFSLFVFICFFKHLDFQKKPISPLLILSLVWFLLSVFMVYSARGFSYDYSMTFQLMDFQFILIPFILLTTFTLLLLYQLLAEHFLSYNKFFASVFCLAFVIILCFQSSHFLYWSFYWGDYFGAAQSAKEQVDTQVSNALFLWKESHAFPFVAVSSQNNTYLMISNLSDPSLYASFAHNYSAVFLFSQDVPLTPPEQSIILYYYHGNIVVENPWVIRQLRHQFYHDIYYSQFLVYQYIP